MKEEHIVTLAVGAVTAACSFIYTTLYTKFKVEQNSVEIEEFKKLLKELQTDQPKEFEKLYNLIRDETSKIRDKMDIVKQTFRSSETCDSLRTECHRKK